MNKDLCTNKACSNYGRYSRYCSHYKLEAEPQKKIAAYSEKRQVINRKQYGPESKKYLKEHPECEIGIKGECTGKAQGIHHVKGRTTIKDLLNKDYWKAACNACNGWVESHSGEARERKLKVSKHEHEPGYKRAV